MPRFYFIDTNIILGYCNPFDRLHPISIPFFDAITNKRNIFLLHSVEKEYYGKTRLIRIEFERKITKKLRSGPLKLIEIRQDILGNAPKNTYPFEEYILGLFEQQKVEIITYADLMKILSIFISRMRDEFKRLITHWIVRPIANEYPTFISDPQYTKYMNKIGNSLHYPDNLHLVLAILIIIRRSPEHDYIFYTDDNQYIVNNLEKIINLSNLKIKKIKYNILRSLYYNPNTKSFSLTKECLEYLHDEDLV